MDNDQSTSLPARPNLDHLRGQAKKLLARLEDSASDDAARAFIEHLPAARGLTPAALRATKPKLADAQSVVARQNGFSSWAVLVTHVEVLRSLEGDWRIARMEVDGAETPAMYLEGTRISMDGDRFRTASPGATYEGVFAIDTQASPPHFDIHFVAGPEAGNTSRGIYRIDGRDELVLCLGLVGSQRPTEFATKPGSAMALEHLRRVSAARPENVTGGTPPPPEAPRDIPRGEAAAFAYVDTPLVRRLQGTWDPVELVVDGKPMPDEWLRHGTRTMTDNLVTVVFGGQKMVNAKVRIDESVSPTAVDYLHLGGKHEGGVTYGILDWQGDELRLVMAAAGDPRPETFEAPPEGTLARWRKRG